MSSTAEMKFLYPFWMVALAMLAFLVLLILCTPMEVHKQHWNNFKGEFREIVGPHALFFQWNIGITLGLFAVGELCSVIGDWLEWPELRHLGHWCKFFGLVSLLISSWLVKSKAEAQANEKARKALFGPRTVMSNNFNNFGNNYGNQAVGQSVHQEGTANAITINERINRVIEQVEADAGLDAARKREAIAELNILAEQARLPGTERTEARVKTALRLIPGLISVAHTVMEEWDKLEPWIRAHFAA
jgi:hypothetical protein